jgi:hypothetical protein
MGGTSPEVVPGSGEHEVLASTWTGGHPPKVNDAASSESRPVYVDES